MVSRVVERIGQAILTVFIVVSFSFAMIRLLPGGPADYLKAQLIQQQSMSIQQINEITQAYLNINPDEPIYVQYIDYLVAVAHGDLGKSVWYQKPVLSILANALPWTIFILSIAMVLTFSIGILLGALMAYNEGSRFDVISTIISIIVNSIPYYVAAIIFLYVLAYQWGWFPTGGRLPTGVEPSLSVSFILGALYHAALPILSLVITGFGGWALSMRGNSIRILGEDYLRVARLRGVPSNRIAFRYVGRNAILPMYTSFMISIGFLFGGAIILEQIFTYPGVGYYMLQAINARDYPLMMGGFLIITIAVVIGVFIADLTYGKLDPRAGGDHEFY